MPEGGYSCSCHAWEKLRYPSVDFIAVLLLTTFMMMCVHLWLRTRNVALLLLMGLLYNYVLHAYIVVFVHDFFGYGREKYWYDSMPYFVTLDRTYVEAIVVSLAFASAFMLPWLALPYRDSALRSSDTASLSIDGWPLLTMAIVSYIIGMAPWIGALERFLSEGTSSYGGFKSGEELGSYLGRPQLMLPIVGNVCLRVVLAGIGMGERLTVRISRFVSIYWCFLIVLWLLVFCIDDSAR